MSRTIATSNGEEAVKVSIPRQLYMKLLKVQVSDNVDWDEACVKASKLLDSNSEEFKQAVQRESTRIYKARHLAELNKARETIRREAEQTVRNTENNWRVPCGKCGKPMFFSSRESNWESQLKPVLYKAFAGWSHVSC